MIENGSAPLSVYIHLPWCVQKCGYCDFNSHALQGDLPEESYLAALRADWRLSAAFRENHVIQTVFFGGGTPSLFSPDAIARILSWFEKSLIPDAEITLEANPGTIDQGQFARLKTAGVNRLSLGVQSFDDRTLQRLQRLHSGDEARAAILEATDHFSSWNLDLMHGLPEQTPEKAAADLEEALSFSPPHLSTYQLTIEAHTAFAENPPILPDEDTMQAIENVLESRLKNKNYRHYETSAHAQNGFQCQHNLNYWQFGDYLGLGAGAHSKLTQDNVCYRQTRHSHPKSYLKAAATGQFIDQAFVIAPDHLPVEFMMNALRLNAGFPLTLFESRTGLPLSVLENPLKIAAQQGLIEKTPTHIKPTLKGQKFLNRLISLFLPTTR